MIDIIKISTMAKEWEEVKVKRTISKLKERSNSARKSKERKQNRFRY